MTDQSYAAQVAADVAARYGMPVSAKAVQLVPRGVSATPLPIWDGSQLVYTAEARTSWRSKQLANYRNRNVSPKAINRRLQVAALHAEGLHDAAIAAQLGEHQSVVANDRKRLGLIAIPSRNSQVGREDRNASIRAYMAQGWGAEAIAAEIGVSATTVKDVARNVLRIPFTTSRKMIAAAKPKPPRLVKERAKQPVLVRVATAKPTARPSALQQVSQQRLAALRAMINGLGRDLTRADLDAYAAQIGRTTHQMRRDMASLELQWPRPPNWRAMATIRLSPVERQAVRDRRRADIAAMDLMQVTVADLMQQFGVSKQTISRDLAALQMRTKLPARGLRGAIKDAVESHRAIIRDLHAKGADRAAIKQATGLGRNAISRHLKALGLHLPRGYVDTWAGRPRPGMTDRVKQLQARIAEMRGAGKSYAEIMAETGLKKASVSRHLLELGLTGRQANQTERVAA
ncbi:DeoR family transcriptional regulator [Cypionkella sinensis]|uniref:DeoR family transcriptional regulator n=1 Tax=Cypionkella sinensis TaxID=1756043 RepID=A0ABV7J170_9RHOB